MDILLENISLSILIKDEWQSMYDTLEGREERFVRDRLHKVSRHTVEWSCQFEGPYIVFEQLKEMRDSIDYGTWMNRRLHHLPFCPPVLYVVQGRVRRHPD
jgi:hypothetical protein